MTPQKARLLTIDAVENMARRYKAHGDLDSWDWEAILATARAAMRCKEALQEIVYEDEGHYFNVYQEGVDLAEYVAEALKPFQQTGEDKK